MLESPPSAALTTLRYPRMPPAWRASFSPIAFTVATKLLPVVPVVLPVVAPVVVPLVLPVVVLPVVVPVVLPLVVPDVLLPRL